MGDVPGWAKGVIAILSFLMVATNGLQYFGVSAPVQETATVAKEDRDFCHERLKETMEELRKCYKECPQ